MLSGEERGGYPRTTGELSSMSFQALQQVRGDGRDPLRERRWNDSSIGYRSDPERGNSQIDRHLLTGSPKAGAYLGATTGRRAA